MTFSARWMLNRGHSVKIEGSVHPAFMKLANALERQLAGARGGAALCVYHRGEPVVDLWGGARDSEGSPWLRETMAPSFSTTKGVASTLLHMMVDRGLIDYDDRVVKFWPEFGQCGKEQITVRQVMAHQSGLYHIRQMIDHADRMLDWDHMIQAIERSTPIHPPGERTGYHGLTYGYLVGEILQRLSGHSFSDLVRGELAEPLDLDGMYVGAPHHVLPRAAELLWPAYLDRLATAWTHPAARILPPLTRGLGGHLQRVLRFAGVEFDWQSIVDALGPRGISSFDFGNSDALRAAIPSGNGLFTARSLARMYAVLAAGGSLDGVELMSAGTLARATEVQTAAPGRAVLPFDMRWRLGYHAIFTTRGAPPSAFGHFGFGGSGAWADPERDLALAMIVNCGMGTPFGDLRIARMSGTALRCADGRA